MDTEIEVDAWFEDHDSRRQVAAWFQAERKRLDPLTPRAERYNLWAWGATAR